MDDFREIILGTHNQKKAGELRALLEPHRFRVSSLNEYPDAIEVEETGTSFAENAALKAVQQARHLNAFVIGEDSGLCVDALDGAPGIYSARFSGENATDEKNNQVLLEKLCGVPLEKRTAHYVCHIAISDPDGNILASREATCRGRIRERAAGVGGFGYDPLFEILELHKTFGELGPTFKSVISHRAKALGRFIPDLLRLFRPPHPTSPAISAAQGRGEGTNESAGRLR